VATESDLRDLLQGPDPEGRTAIDLDAVLRRARARRRPRAIAASAVGALALVGVLTPVVLISQQATNESSLMVAEDSGGAAEASTAEDQDFATVPSAASLVSCGAPVIDHASGDALVLEVAPITADAGSASIPIEVTLRNDGPTSLVGATTSLPVVVFSRDGVVLWYSSPIQDASGVRVDLDPGESMTYATTFEPVTCTAGVEAESGDSDGLREDLPAAGAGSYRLSAAIDFIADDGTGAILVTGPAAPVELR
jgi:hypothetical protein